MNNGDQLEELRQRVIAGVRAYEAKLDSDLAVYRSQRAWRLMLAARKAYALALRNGSRGPLRALNWFLHGVLGRSLDLDSQELRFPELADFLPEELFCHGFSVSELKPPPEARHDILVFPIFEFEFRFQRPQQMAAEFARRGHRVFWLSPTRVVGRAAREPYEVVPLRQNLWELRLRIKAPDPFGGELSARDVDAMLEGLVRWHHEYAIATAVSLVQFPFWRRPALALRQLFGMPAVYDCMDDWQNWTSHPPIGAFSRAEETKLARESDVLLVSSREFEQRHTAAGLSPLLVRNAADFEFFRSGRASGLLASVPRPIIGYYGAIAEWFDLPLIEKVARSRPQYSFVLIGQNSRSDIHRLKNLPNVFLTGEKRYRDLPAYLREFDVCLIPFALSPLTRGVDPVKLYEYLSQGKPVVSTPLPELAARGDLVHLGTTPAEFSAKIDAALKETGAALEEKRIRVASENTWTHRVETVSESIRAKYPLISILIVTYNCQEFLRPCLDSIRRVTKYPNYEVVVVDNHSLDSTPGILAQYAAADPRVRVHVLSENRGFSGGNNEAARLSRGEYLLLLNADTIVTSGWLHRLLRVLQTDPAAGVAAPVTNYSGNETKINFHYRDLSSLEEFARTLAIHRAGERSEVSVAPLFCALVSRKLWLTLEGLDERFHIGMFEDDDFCLRVRKAGHSIVVAEDCMVHHFGGGSFDKLSLSDSTQVFEDNRRLFEEKWGKKWTPHRLRPGVTPPLEDRRFTPAAFVASASKPS